MAAGDMKIHSPVPESGAQNRAGAAAGLSFAEPLYDLACFLGERGMNDASVLFAKAGVSAPATGERDLDRGEFRARSGAHGPRA